MDRILLADDEPAILRAYGRLLQRAGFDVITASDGEHALAALQEGHLDAIVSDIMMPRMNGVKLLAAVRERDLDVPVILMTGGASLELAAEAVAFGASHLLLKPLPPNQLVETVQRAVALHRLARLKRQALEMMGAEDKLLGDAAALTVHFEKALASLWMAYQPIVSLREQRVYAYEALVRSDDPQLSRPDLLFDAAQRLGRLHELGRRIRAQVTRAMASAPRHTLMFVNLRSEDLEDGELVSATAPLSSVAGRVVLEITERNSIEGVRNLPDRIAALRRLGFGIAVDDLGAGYAGLTTLAQLQPDVVKLDMSLVRDIDANATKREIVSSMTRLCRQLGMRVVSEGVETERERDALIESDCDLLQGFLFARPERRFAEPALARASTEEEESTPLAPLNAS
jgi:EAL domain-containing protein (putative c-di-GMP-specific phosphodiesterase class I)